MRKLLYFIIIMGVCQTAGFASYEEALQLYTQKKYEDSLTQIASELVIEKDFDQKSPNYELRYLAAHNHWKLGNYESAAAHLKRCTEIQKDITDPLIDLAALLIEQKKFREAETYTVRALSIQKEPMAYYLTGKAAYGVGNFWRAKEFYEKAISLDPELYVAYNGLGCSLMKLERYSQANTAFSAALAIAPDSAEVLNNMGLSLEKLGRANDALAYYKKASEYAPDNPVIVANLNRLGEKQK